MSEEFIEWDVHATTDALTPRVEYNDPLTQFSESEVCSTFITNSVFIEHYLEPLLYP